MSKMILRFSDIEIEKLTFHCTKHLNDMDRINVEKVVISYANAFSYNEKKFKYLVGLRWGKKYIMYKTSKKEWICKKI